MPSSPEEDMTQGEKWIEDYKSLTFWDKHDNDAVIAFGYKKGSRRQSNDCK
jgi:hypothetical protein